MRAFCNVKEVWKASRRLLGWAKVGSTQQPAKWGMRIFLPRWRLRETLSSLTCKVQVYPKTPKFIKKKTWHCLLFPTWPNPTNANSPVTAPWHCKMFLLLSSRRDHHFYHFFSIADLLPYSWHIYNRIVDWTLDWKYTFLEWNPGREFQSFWKRLIQFRYEFVRTPGT